MIGGMDRKSLEDIYGSRKSYLYRQEIRRKSISPQVKCLVAIVMIILVMGYYVCWGKSQEELSVESVVGKYMHSAQIQDFSQTNSTTSLYLDKYCTQGACQTTEKKILTDLIQLLQQKPQKNTVDEQKRQKLNKNVMFAPLISQKKDWKRILESSSIESLQRLNLHVIKHPKLTTPQSPPNGLLHKFADWIVGKDPYQNIDLILSDQKYQWFFQKEGSMLTVGAKKGISPKVIEVESEGTSQLVIMGLLLSLDKQVVAIRLGRFNLKQGNNKIYCLIDQCLQTYPMILLMLGPVKLFNLKMYTLKNQ